jgi:hypothetical protein
MDDRKFDNFVRSLSSRGSRRGLLAGFVSSLLAALAVAPNDEDAAARNRRRRCQRRCGTCKRCRRGRCRPKPDGTTCGSGKTCQRGRCVCLAGTTDCGGVCVNTATDPRNCGTCGKRCQINAVCMAGICDCARGSCTGGGPDATCCATGPICSCVTGPPPPQFINPHDCSNSPTCPMGTTPCVGPVCSACCPAGSTCDPSTGQCLQ